MGQPGWPGQPLSCSLPRHGGPPCSQPSSHCPVLAAWRQYYGFLSMHAQRTALRGSPTLAHGSRTPEVPQKGASAEPPASPGSGWRWWPCALPPHNPAALGTFLAGTEGGLSFSSLSQSQSVPTLWRAGRPGRGEGTEAGAPRGQDWPPNRQPEWPLRRLQLRENSFPGLSEVCPARPTPRLPGCSVAQPERPVLPCSSPGSLGSSLSMPAILRA